jgi:hypothetical protein
LIHAVIAFVCAVEPSAFRVPVEQVVALPALEVLADVELAFVVEPPPELLLLLLQAASAVMAASTPAATPTRLILTIGTPSSIDVPIGTLGVRNGATGERR